MLTKTVAARALVAASSNVYVSQREYAYHVDRHGTGGRSSVSGIVATVFGATGFLGRYVVNRLGQRGSQLVIPYRGTDRVWAHLKPLGDLGQIIPIKTDFSDPVSLQDSVYRSNVVINLLGTRWDTKNFSMQEVNEQLCSYLAKISKEAGVEHFIHVSAFGASPNSKSEWARTKWRGEQAVKEQFPNAIVLRPATMYGFEDRYLNRYAAYARFWPVFPLVLPDFRERPISVIDVTSAIVAALENRHELKGQTFELLGNVTVTNRGLAEMVREATKLESKFLVDVPLDIAKNMAFFQQLLRRPRITVDELSYMEEDKVEFSKDINGTAADLNVDLEDLDRSRLLRFIRHYRKPNFINMIE